MWTLDLQLGVIKESWGWEINFLLFFQVNSQLISNVCTDALSAEKVKGELTLEFFCSRIDLVTP